jgi:hypothetical protein
MTTTNLPFANDAKAMAIYKREVEFYKSLGSQRPEEEAKIATEIWVNRMADLKKKMKKSGFTY